MKKSDRKKQRRNPHDVPAQKGAKLPATDAQRLYPHRPIQRLETFELESAAIQEILDAVVRLQTYIALRQRRQ